MLRLSLIVLFLFCFTGCAIEQVSLTYQGHDDKISANISLRPIDAHPRNR